VLVLFLAKYKIVVWCCAAE